MEETNYSEIINYMLKTIKNIWLDQFDVINTLPKSGNIPCLVWKNLLFLDISILNQFPDSNIDINFIHHLSHFWIISLDSFILSNPSSIDIYNFSKHFLNNSFKHFQLINTE